eukprot:NODE_134_length_16603_cov_0.784052.p14 type:complete len:154 gc:universal NODE_134_length_16603_cov_0.784052:1681-2142(+)
MGCSLGNNLIQMNPNPICSMYGNKIPNPSDFQCKVDVIKPKTTIPTTSVTVAAPITRNVRLSTKYATSTNYSEMSQFSILFNSTKYQSTTLISVFSGYFDHSQSIFNLGFMALIRFGISTLILGWISRSAYDKIKLKLSRRTTLSSNQSDFTS